jgi:hypothetical protein
VGPCPTRTTEKDEPFPAAISFEAVCFAIEPVYSKMPTTASNTSRLIAVLIALPPPEAARQSHPGPQSVVGLFGSFFDAAVAASSGCSSFATAPPIPANSISSLLEG